MLALEAVEIALTLQPRLLVFENVPEMENTLIERLSVADAAKLFRKSEDE